MFILKDTSVKRERLLHSLSVSVSCIVCSTSPHVTSFSFKFILKEYQRERYEERERERERSRERGERKQKRAAKVING